jgi:hypothetical protein
MRCRLPSTSASQGGKRTFAQASPTWPEHWKNNPKSFIWKATAEDITTKVQSGRETLHQIKTQTDHYLPVVVRTACARGSSMSGNWAVGC